MCSVIIEEYIDTDMSQAFEILSLALRHDHPYVESVFPNHKSPKGRQIGAVDAETVIMIGHARWSVCNNGFEPEGDYYDTEDQKEFAAWMFSQSFAPRRTAIREYGRHLVSLDLMAVHPEYQRQGVGNALLQWGLELADILQVDAVLEASNQGKGLYQSAGYEVQYRYEVKLPEKWAGKKTQHFWWMVKPKQPSINPVS